MLTLIELAVMLPFVPWLPCTMTVSPGLMLGTLVVTVLVTFAPVEAVTLTVLP